MIPFRNNSQPTSIAQFQAGAMHSDHSGYAQYGFNHLRIKIENDQLAVEATAHSYTYAPSDELHWVTEDITVNGQIQLLDADSQNNQNANNTYAGEALSDKENRTRKEEIKSNLNDEVRNIRNPEEEKEDTGRGVKRPAKRRPPTSTRRLYEEDGGDNNDR